MAFRRTGVGKASLTRHLQNQDQFRQRGSELEAQQLASLKEDLAQFQQKLQEFALVHKKRIQNDPVFRQYFQRMCTEIGVDPLQSSKGFWSEMLGVGEFYYELGIQIIELSIKTRHLNGGLMEVDQLINMLRKLRIGKAQDFTEDDVLRAMKTLRPLGDHYQLKKIGDRNLFASMPKELDLDQIAILKLAQDKGYLTYPMIKESLKWGNDRIDKVLELLSNDELCWIDEQVNPTQYWISTYFKAETI